MSAAPVYPKAPRPGEAATRRPAVRRLRRKSSLLNQIVGSAIAFGAVVVVTFGFSTLLGHSMKEGARRDAIRAQERAKTARADVSRIRGRVERLTTMRAVEEWTKFNGYVTGYQFAKSVPAKPSSKPAFVAKKASEVKVDVLVARVDNGGQVR